MSLSVDIDQITKDLVKDLNRFERELIPKVNRRVILRVSRTATSRWLRAAAKRARVKTALLNKRMFNKPYKGDGRIVGISTAPIPAAIAGPKGKLPRPTRNGIRIAGRTYKKGFIATAKLGRRPEQKALFQREGSARGPIDEIRLPVEGAITSTAPVEVPKTVMERWPIEMKSQLDREVARLKGARRR